MPLFHVYNKFDSMDLVHVAAKSESEAIALAIEDGFLVRDLSVKLCNIVALPFSPKNNTSKYVRLIKGIL